MRTLVFLLCLCGSVANTHAAIVIDFESLPTGASGFYNGDTSVVGPQRNNYSVLSTRDNFGSTEFVQRWVDTGVQFENNYTPNFGSWNGWSWSRVQNSTTAGFTNQYASFPGGGANASGNVQPGGTYAIGFGNGIFFNLPTDAALQSIDIANATYAALSMRDGDTFAKRFGGASGNDPDFFRVTLRGFNQVDGTGSSVGSTTIDLADYRFANNAMDFILNRWVRVDLSTLIGARSVSFQFESSDVGGFGINTPLTIAIDNLTLAAVPEPSSIGLVMVVVGTMALRRKR
jgi:Domain of unknown function (DUF4465)/PEP-CTERM motif